MGRRQTASKRYRYYALRIGVLVCLLFYFYSYLFASASASLPGKTIGALPSGSFAIPYSKELLPPVPSSSVLHSVPVTTFIVPAPVASPPVTIVASPITWHGEWAPFVALTHKPSNFILPPALLDIPPSVTARTQHGREVVESFLWGVKGLVQVGLKCDEVIPATVECRHQHGVELCDAVKLVDGAEYCEQAGKAALKCDAIQRNDAACLCWAGSPHNDENGFALSLLESLDTMYLMGLYDLFNATAPYVAGAVYQRWCSPHRPSAKFSVFESIIRVVGGLSAAYELSGRRELLEAAACTGDVLLHAFGSEFPHSEIDVKTFEAKTRGFFPAGCVWIAEVASMQLEFTKLSQLTGNTDYQKAAFHNFDTLLKLAAESKPMIAEYICDHAHSTRGAVTVSAGADSAFEYFLKLWIMLPEADAMKPLARAAYLTSAEAVLDRLIRWTRRDSDSEESACVTKLSSSRGGGSSTMDSLACFTGGTLALGVLSGAVPGADRSKHIRGAVGIGRECHLAASSTVSGLLPEMWQCSSHQPLSGNAHYIHRPESVETLYYLSLLQQKETALTTSYIDWAVSFRKSLNALRAPFGGIRGVHDVNKPYAVSKDIESRKQQSFILAETFKYLYLIHEPQCLDISEVVLNTEAHPLRVLSRPMSSSPSHLHPL